jgi:hypothetical protein
MMEDVMRLLAVLVFSICTPALAQVQFKHQPGKVEVSVGGRPFTVFYYAGDVTKPILHPLTTASGKRVTRGWPMETIGKESDDHPHHRGLWITHGDVNGYDFWANEKDPPNPKGGIITKGSIVDMKDGDATGALRATFEWQSPTGKPLLTEDRTMTFMDVPNMRVIDFVVRLTAIEKVTFGETKEGFFALRMRDELTEQKGTGVLVNSDGAKTMKDVWGKRAKWVDYSGQLEGEAVGVAIFDHPRNPNSPTWWHARAYGLFAANPFGAHEFDKDTNVTGSLTLEPGQSARFRYRVLIHQGDAQSAAIAEEYARYIRRQQ